MQQDAQLQLHNEYIYASARRQIGQISWQMKGTPLRKLVVCFPVWKRWQTTYSDCWVFPLGLSLRPLMWISKCYPLNIGRTLVLHLHWWLLLQPSKTSRCILSQCIHSETGGKSSVMKCNTISGKQNSVCTDHCATLTTEGSAFPGEHWKTCRFRPIFPWTGWSYFFCEPQ